MEKMITKLKGKYVSCGDPEKGYSKLKAQAMPEDWRAFYNNYILQFGKHKGTKVTDMVEPQQISWLIWYYNYCKSNPKTDVTYRVIKWYLHLKKFLPKAKQKSASKFRNSILSI
jgi:hypothetical protein